jgi:hypothetical protein
MAKYQLRKAVHRALLSLDEDFARYFDAQSVEAWIKPKKTFGLFGLSHPAWPEYRGMARNNIE